MYLTAQRVRNPATGEEGINSYCYLHGPHVWESLPPNGIPDENPGDLASASLVVQPPGNRVRSYLDVVAPDETSWSEIRPAFVAFVSEARAEPLPWVGVKGRCWFRLGIEAGLVDAWARELAELYRAVQAVRIGG